jgi:RNA polymerase sigma-70 factor (ECF subfamily)
VRSALDGLSPLSRDVIMLRYLEEFDGEETAKILRVPKGTVRSRLSRGLAELAGLLAPAPTVAHP